MALAGDKPTADDYNLATEKLVWRGYRETSSSTLASNTPVLRLDDLPIKAGYAYTIVVVWHAKSTVANDVIEARLRYTTDGTTPTAASATLAGSTATAQTPGNTAWIETSQVETVYVPASDETLSLLLVGSRIAGTGNCTMFADVNARTDVRVYQSGPDVGNSGTAL